MEVILVIYLFLGAQHQDVLADNKSEYRHRRHLLNNVIYVPHTYQNPENLPTMVLVNSMRNVPLQRINHKYYPNDIFSRQINDIDEAFLPPDDIVKHSQIFVPIQNVEDLSESTVDQIKGTASIQNTKRLLSEDNEKSKMLIKNHNIHGLTKIDPEENNVTINEHKNIMNLDDQRVKGHNEIEKQTYNNTLQPIKKDNYNTITNIEVKRPRSHKRRKNNHASKKLGKEHHDPNNPENKREVMINNKTINSTLAKLINPMIHVLEKSTSLTASIKPNQSTNIDGNTAKKLESTKSHIDKKSSLIDTSKITKSNHDATIPDRNLDGKNNTNLVQLKELMKTNETMPHIGTSQDLALTNYSSRHHASKKPYIDEHMNSDKLNKTDKSSVNSKEKVKTNNPIQKGIETNPRNPFHRFRKPKIIATLKKQNKTDTLKSGDTIISRDLIKNNAHHDDTKLKYDEKKKTHKPITTHDTAKSKFKDIFEKSKPSQSVTENETRNLTEPKSNHNVTEHNTTGEGNINDQTEDIQIEMEKSVQGTFPAYEDAYNMYWQYYIPTQTENGGFSYPMYSNPNNQYYYPVSIPGQDFYRIRHNLNTNIYNPNNLKNKVPFFPKNTNYMWKWHEKLKILLKREHYKSNPMSLLTRFTLQPSQIQPVVSALDRKQNKKAKRQKNLESVKFKKI